MPTIKQIRDNVEKLRDMSRDPWASERERFNRRLTVETFTMILERLKDNADYDHVSAVQADPTE